MHDRLRKLQDFFHTPLYHELELIERDLLRMQHHAMEVYLRILNMRLGAFVSKKARS